jgi:hypothetical protein
MVMEAIRVQEQAPAVLPAIDVVEAGARIGVPVVIRPWWGSRRRFYIRKHKECGGHLFYRGEQWCFECGRYISAKEVEVIRAVPGRWICPAGYGSQLKWPAVEGDKVVMWAGRCGARYGAAQMKRYGSAIHVHRQELEVLDFSATAMLVRVSVSKHRLSFLISRDDGRPFVHVVTRHQVTVAEAYDYMVPVPVFNARMHGFKVPRQGDWFFVPREFWTPAKPRVDESKALAWLDRQPRFESGVLFSNAPLERTRHVAELFIWGWPHTLVKGTVTAPDHPPVHLATWHCAIRNKRPAAANPDAAGVED